MSKTALFPGSFDPFTSGHLNMPKLSVISHRTAVIPTDGGGEVLCYEYTCRAGNGRKVLVYINAVTAKEEQVLLLEENENGTLTI